MAITDALDKIHKRSKIQDALGLALVEVLEFIRTEVNLCGVRGKALKDMERFTAVRPVVREFAIEMEKKLAKNDHKTEWNKLPLAAFVRRLQNEVEEMKMAIEYETPEAVTKECADIANFALIIADRANRDCRKDEPDDRAPDQAIR